MHTIKVTKATAAAVVGTIPSSQGGNPQVSQFWAELREGLDSARSASAPAKDQTEEQRKARERENQQTGKAGERGEQKAERGEQHGAAAAGENSLTITVED